MMRTVGRYTALACMLVGALAAACSGPPQRRMIPAKANPAVLAPSGSTALPSSDAATLAALDRVIAGRHRSEANRSRDVYRHPKETLAFFGVRQDMTVMEVWPGASGWYTEVLAPLLKEHGRYIAAGLDVKSDAKFSQDSVRSFQAKLAPNPELYDKVEVAALEYPSALAPVPPASVDLIVTFRNLHNWLARDGAAPAMLAAMYAALKPGGVLGLVDHRADPASPVDPKAKAGYVNQGFAIDLLERAGFEFIGSSEVNANPRDNHDHEVGVWTLPPTWRLGDRDRDKYAAIGESDRFTLRFRKPLAR